MESVMKYVLLIAVIGIAGCATKDPASDLPAWARQPSRVVDNGYIVYIGTASDHAAERAQFKAEGIALEDLANECSVVPQGARIEDRFVSHGTKDQTAYIKLGVEFAACEDAKKAVDPESVRRTASVTFTQQLKKYQDFAETGEVVAQGEETEVEVPADVAPAPELRRGDGDSVHFYVTRQYIAYQKEIVVLAPQAAYAPQSPESQHFAAAVVPSTQQVQTLAQANPQLAKNPAPWSQVLDRPRVDRPKALSHQISLQMEKTRAAQRVKPPHNENHKVTTHGPKSKHDDAPPKKKKGRRRR